MKKSYALTYLFLFILMLLQCTLLQAQSNQYLHFDREDDFVQLENGSQYVVNSPGITMAGWFYTDEQAYGQGMMSFRSGSEGFYLIQLNNGTLESRFINSAGGFFEVVGPANTIIPQVWQHIAWVYDGSAVKLYINGTLKGSTAASGQLSDPNVAFTIGKCLLGTFNFVFGGRADEVSVWNKGLSQSEIQDLMDNELTGTESGLQMYYKFNQGDPGGNNTSITKLISEVDSPTRDADLLNFAMTGPTSNFNGTLDPGYQAISFPQIPNKLTTDEPFTIEATATSGLPVSFEILSGPATIDGNLITLTGEQGEVAVQATQEGNGTYDPADPVINYFMVVDPTLNVPYIDARNPLPGNVYVRQLNQIQLAAISNIEYPELFQVQSLKFRVDGQNIPAFNYGNDHYEAWWTPPSYGTYAIEIISTNNFGATATETVNIDIVDNPSNMEVTAFEGLWLNTDINSITVDAELPSFLGAFNNITATLEVRCPSGGCGEWDRVASVDAKGHNGEWIEIIRYITPYGVPCSHTIDLSDYMSILQGKISFRANCSTLDNGYEYYLTLNYGEGAPAHYYGSVKKVWKDIYPFGDYADLQPVETVDYSFPDNTVAAKLKLVSTGHGWGNLNTSNAAEFYDASHHIWVDGTQTFEQHNWYDCNPNPDGCQPQNGTWYYNRAGWCPGSIAQWFDYDLNSYITENSITLQYRFFENYVDYCHPNHPDCVTGVTCSNCNDGFNPSLDVACNAVAFSDNPIVGENESQKIKSSVEVSPNPSSGIINLSIKGVNSYDHSSARIYNVTGTTLREYDVTSANSSFDLSDLPKGLYFIQVKAEETVHTRKVILQ